MRDILDGDCHGCAKFVGFSEDVGVKERFANDAHRDVGHMSIHVNSRTIGPGLLNLLTVVAHDVGIAGNMTWLEQWGHEFTLVTMQIAFATEDAITDDRPKGIMHCQTFIEVIGMFDQHALDVCWLVEQDAGERSKMQAVNVAFARYTLQKA